MNRVPRSVLVWAACAAVGAALAVLAIRTVSDPATTGVPALPPAAASTATGASTSPTDEPTGTPVGQVGVAASSVGLPPSDTPSVPTAPDVASPSP